jgi:ParB family transcriptional regulator, chromosome partitioning protein
MQDNKSSNLGKGLSSLLKETNIENIVNLSETKNKVKEINLTEISANAQQPRKNFDKEAIGNLASSIQEHGVLQPILLAKNEFDDKYTIIAGERRFRASKLAELKSIPAIILTKTEKETSEIALVENIQRENLDPIEEAQAIRRIISLNSYTQAELSSRLGKSRSYIANSLRLLTLPKDVQELLSQKKLSAGHARTLIGKPEASKLAKQIIEQNLSVRNAENIIANSNQTKPKTANPILEQFNLQKLTYLKKIQDTLKSKTGFQTKIIHKNKKGKLEIFFKNSEELQNIINLLSK